MALGSCRKNIDRDEILLRVSEADIVAYYLGVREIPCVISSPLRDDSKPSFSIHSPDGKRVRFLDFSTGETGGLFDLLGQMWKCSFHEVLRRIDSDACDIGRGTGKTLPPPVRIRPIHGCRSKTDLQCRIREWRRHDIEYWESYGISLEWLRYAEVYPISHKIVLKEGKKYVFPADKYAYAYVEHKEGRTTLKIYQPFNRQGYKWSNKHDMSVISLWTKVPEYGERICICSSLKDALCLWANTGIPSIAVQGEGYGISETAAKELRRRFKRVFILFDNDTPGLQDGKKLSVATGFTNIVLPKLQEYGCPKDISDLFCALHDRERFREIITGLFNQKM